MELIVVVGVVFFLGGGRTCFRGRNYVSVGKDGGMCAVCLLIRFVWRVTECEDECIGVRVC